MNFNSASVGLLAAVLLPFTAIAQEGDTATGDRPADTSVGVGIGYTFVPNVNLFQPNTASARVRFGRLTLEPMVNLGGNSASTRMDGVFNIPNQEPQTTEDEDRASDLDFRAGAQVRYAFASRGPVDLVGLGGVSVGYNSVTAEDDVHLTDQLDRTTSSTVNLALNWGVGLEWFVGSRLSLSADATNPLVSWTTATVRNEARRTVGGQEVTSESETTTQNTHWGLTFNPTVRVMVHLYF